MKRFLLIVIAIMLVITVSAGFAGCKKEMRVINSAFDDMPEGTSVASGLSALTLFDEAIANTYAGDFKRVN
ncbi:MAG: hypothetical protein EOM87_04595, partial [Clostridia bacterium]|nr:hypothetical protein [Clostridia bacterium]